MDSNKSWCCCFKFSVGAIFVGVVDFLLGILGIVGYIYLKVFQPIHHGDGGIPKKKDQQKVYDIPYLKEMYLVFGILTVVTGILILLAVYKKLEWAVYYSFSFTIGLEILLLIVNIGGLLMGYHWIVFLPLVLFLFVQVYIITVVFDYKTEFEDSKLLTA